MTLQYSIHPPDREIGHRERPLLPRRRGRTRSSPTVQPPFITKAVQNAVGQLLQGREEDGVRYMKMAANTMMAENPDRADFDTNMCCSTNERGLRLHCQRRLHRYKKITHTHRNTEVRVSNRQGDARPRVKPHPRWKKQRHPPPKRSNHSCLVRNPESAAFSTVTQSMIV